MTVAFARAFLVLAVASVPAAALAGPCITCAGAQGPVLTGWWRDRLLSTPGVGASDPRIDAGDRFGAPRLAVVWSEGVAGSRDVVLALSEDGGCSFALSRPGAGVADDAAPDVALAPTLDFVALSFVRDREPWVMVSRDGGRSFAPPERVHPTAAVDAASPPRLALIVVDQAIHLHLVWGDGSGLWHARSRAGGSPTSWESPAAPFSASFSGFSTLLSPDLSADSRSSDAQRESAINVVFAGMGPGDNGRQIYFLRSNDSGQSFFGDPSLPATRDQPHRLNDGNVLPVVSHRSRPLIDGSDDGSGAFKAWNAVAWTDDLGNPPFCFADARAEEGAGPTVVSDWNNPPGAGDILLARDAESAAALALVPNPLDRPPTPDLHLFAETLAGGTAMELVAARAVLDARAEPNLAVYCSPYALTGLSPARPGGQVIAGSASADEDLSHAYLVWLDDRDGAAGVWFKRTDTVVDAPRSPWALPVACALGGGVEVGWSLPPSPPNCDLERFRIDYGSSPSSYTNSVDAALPPLRIGGLTPATTWYFRVVAVDEACNEAAAAEVFSVAPDCGVIPACPNGIGGSLRAVKSPALDVDLSWLPGAVDASHGAATSFDVWRAALRGQDGYLPIANALAPFHRDPGAALPSAPAARLFYRIVARNACGTSGDEPPR